MIAVSIDDDDPQRGTDEECGVAAISGNAPEFVEAWERQEALSRQLDLLLFTLDARGDITYMGGRGHYLLGLSADDAHSFREVFRQFPDVLPRIELAYTGRGGTWSTEMLGGVWELHLTPCKNKDGKVIRVHGLGKNVTQRHNVEARIRWQDREIAALHNLSLEISSTLDGDEVMASLRRQMELYLDIGGGALYLLDFQTFEALQHNVWNLSPEQAERLHDHATQRLFPPPTQDIEDTATTPHSLPKELLVQLESEATSPLQCFASGYVIPLISREMLLGVVIFLSHDPYTFYRHHRPFYEMIGRQVGAAVQNARLHRSVTENREQLQHLARRLVVAQEDEQGRLARELHDELGQMLTCLKISLELAEKPDTAPEISQRHRREAHRSVADLLDRVRQMSLQLRPTVLDDIGLMPTLKWHLERFTTQTGISVNFSQADIAGRRFPQGIETAAYRIVQEALTNIARHAQTTEAWVDVRVISLGERGPSLDILIEDCGNGFDSAASRLSSGLSGMRERAIAVGGTLRIVSRPDAGTRVEARLPLLSVSPNVVNADGRPEI